MKKYRVVRVDNMYYPQKRIFFMWFNMVDVVNNFRNLPVFRQTLEKAFQYIDEYIENEKPENKIFGYPAKERLVSKEEYAFADKLKKDMTKTEKVIKKNNKYLD